MFPSRLLLLLRAALQLQTSRPSTSGRARVAETWRARLFVAMPAGSHEPEGSSMQAAKPKVASAEVPPFTRALCAGGRSDLAAPLDCRRGALSGRRSPHRCPRHAADRGDPRPHRPARRRRGFPPRLCALDQGGPGADGAGRGAAARARRRDRRPPDRGQAQGRRLGRARRPIVGAAGLGLGLDARHHRARHPSRRDAGGHRRVPGQAPGAAGGARGDAPGDAAARLAFRAGADDRRGAGARRARRRLSLFLRHAGRGRAHGGGCRALFRRLRQRHRRHRQDCRQCGIARTTGHFGEALGAASALRAVVARARADRACAERAGAGAARQKP